MKNQIQFAVPTLFGLEGLCADEMRRLGLAGVRAENGRVYCTGHAGGHSPAESEPAHRRAGADRAGHVPGPHLRRFV